MSPPNRESVAEIALYAGVNPQTLYSWRHRRKQEGWAGWFLQVHRDKLRVKSSDLPPRPRETSSPTARTVILRTPPGRAPETVMICLVRAFSPLMS
jgi:transposase-like protein